MVQLSKFIFNLGTVNWMVSLNSLLQDPFSVASNKNFAVAEVFASSYGYVPVGFRLQNDVWFSWLINVTNGNSEYMIQTVDSSNNPVDWTIHGKTITLNYSYRYHINQWKHL